MTAIRMLRNNTASTIILPDMNGMEIAPNATENGLAFGETLLRSSVAVQQAILAGSLDLYDGQAYYSGNVAIDVLKGVNDQLTRDGKKIITSSDRPADHYRVITGYGDNLATATIGEGPELVFSVPANVESVLDVQFLDNVYLKDGAIIFQNAALDSKLTIETIVPAGIPFPAASGNGNTDFNGTAFVPNTTNTGKYWTLGTETRVHRFVNGLHILGTGREEVTSPEPVLIPTPYITRFRLKNASTVDVLQAVVNMGLYRKSTI